MIPIAGSAYTYSYATMGELVAWIIGWDLVLEYAIGAATVAHRAGASTSTSCSTFVRHRTIPCEWCHSPFESCAMPSGTVAHGIMNMPAVFIICAADAAADPRHAGVGARQRHHRRHQGHASCILVIVLGWALHQPGEPHAVHPRGDDRHDAEGVTHTTAASWASRRRRRRLLRVHRLRRGLDRRAGGQQSQARHADRHPRLARDLHRALHPVRARADRHRARSTTSATSGREARWPTRSRTTCPATAGSPSSSRSRSWSASRR